MNHQNILQTLRELTDDERLDAKEKARGVILREIGERPTREQYQGVNVSEYPRWARVMVGALLATVFLSAAMPSLFRLYKAGRDAHLAHSTSQWQAAVVGVSTFMLAEFIIITSTLSASIFFRGRHRWWFALPVIMGLAMAFVGNWVVVQPSTLFEWLETVVPPLVVVFVSFIGERLTLDGIKQSHADERAYQQALSHWTEATRDVERQPRWQVTYGRALLGALRTANERGQGAKTRREFMDGMNRRAWSIAVRREFEIETGNWLTESEAVTLPDEHVSSTSAGGNHERPFGNTAPALVDGASMQTTPNGNGRGTHVTN